MLLRTSDPSLSDRYNPGASVYKYPYIVWSQYPIARIVYHVCSEKLHVLVFFTVCWYPKGARMQQFAADHSC